MDFEHYEKQNGRDCYIEADPNILKAIEEYRKTYTSGAPIKDVFADVPVQDYVDSIWNDIADAEENIADDPMYMILNLARVLAYLNDGLVAANGLLTIFLKCIVA